MTVPLHGTTVLVVGASRGIGLAIAREVAADGASVVLAARSTVDLERACAELVAAGHRARPVELDVTDRGSIAAALDEAGPVDACVSVVGTNVRKPLVDYDDTEIDGLLATNLRGPLDLAREVGRRMVATGRGGRFVFIGSAVSTVGLPNVSVYTLTKAALAGLTRSLAAEWGPHGITVNCLSPGFVLTDLNREMWQASELRAWLDQTQALGRLGSVEDIAPAAAFLCGPGAAYVTGQEVVVDGGLSSTKRWPLASPAAAGRPKESENY